MARRRPRERSKEPEKTATTTIPGTARDATNAPEAPTCSRRKRLGVAAGVILLLTIHLTLSVRSLVLENPTVDEVIHLPAGISYWQTGTFKLYHHNPPLVKLFAAWPVVRSGVKTESLYREAYWQGDYPNKAAFAHAFAEINADDYFELFTRARLLMPLFSVIGGLVVFAWSAKLYGGGGGLLSLALWTFCPNILAHARLITTDVAATSIGVLATFLFWLYLRRPTWTRTILAGLLLGVAQLTKFSLLLLYGIWPFLWIIREVSRGHEGRWRRLGRSTAQGLLMVVLSVVVIDVGYGFEGVGRPLGYMPFVSAALTRPRAHPEFNRPRPLPGDLSGRIREYRVNRFQGTWLQGFPSPLPSHYLLGFDDQKLEADGIWNRFLTEKPEQGDALGGAGDEVSGYPVYLDGTLRTTSWWHYYLAALAYKVPEGTWLLAILSGIVLVRGWRARCVWSDELTLMAFPMVALLIMSFLTNINLGLRYVLPIFPYVIVAIGKLVPWASALSTRRRQIGAAGVVGLSLATTIGSTLFIHPHYLAYFNAVSGGPGRGASHLIDSNLDWGQDLVTLKRWLDENHPGERVGLAYFGQINPNIFQLRHKLRRTESGLDWYLPPPRPRTMRENSPRYISWGRATRLEPGWYAVSASLVRGLPWRVYDSVRWPPYDAWIDAFSYFKELNPERQIGHSIFIYHVTKEDSERLAWIWAGENGGGR